MQQSVAYKGIALTATGIMRAAGHHVSAISANDLDDDNTWHLRRGWEDDRENDYSADYYSGYGSECRTQPNWACTTSDAAMCVVLRCVRNKATRPANSLTSQPMTAAARTVDRSAPTRDARP